MLLPWLEAQLGLRTATGVSAALTDCLCLFAFSLQLEVAAAETLPKAKAQSLFPFPFSFFFELAVRPNYDCETTVATNYETGRGLCS